MTPKQERFVAEYLIDLNATQAAIRAGYSAKTAKQIGSRLLTNVDVAAAVARRAERSAVKLEITAEMVLTGLLTEATRLDEFSAAGARVAAWHLLAKHLGLCGDKLQLNVTGNLPHSLDEMLAAIERERKERANGHAVH